MIGLAACSASSAPHVPSLGGSSDASSGSPATSSTATAQGNPTQMLDQWAACMRQHGDPGQTDPIVEANEVIDISISPGVQGGVYGYSGEYGNGGPGVHCRAELTAAQVALGYTPPGPLSKQQVARELKFSRCMRASGYPTFPDPSSNGHMSLSLGSGLDPTSPAFKTASKLCAQRTGVRSLGGVGTPAGQIQIDGSNGFLQPPNG